MFVTVVGTAVMVKAFFLQLEIDALKAGGQKSSVHQFVVDKYLSCERGSFIFISSKDECVSRVMVLARAQGAEYETQVGAAIRDLGLDK